MESNYLIKVLNPNKIESFKSRKKKKLINNILKNTFIVSIFLISYYLYYLSLEKCYEGEDKFCKKIRWIKKKVIQLFSSCTLVAVLLELILYKIISLFHLIHLIIVLFSFYK